MVYNGRALPGAQPTTATPGTQQEKATMADTPNKIAVCVGINYAGADPCIPALHYRAPRSPGPAPVNPLMPKEEAHA